MSKESLPVSLLQEFQGLKGKSVDKTGRADHFYQQHLIPTLRNDVDCAEIARQERDHQTVSEFDAAWRGNNNCQAKSVITKMEQRKQSQEVQQTVKSGLAGIGRITHVDNNTQFSDDLIDENTLDEIVNEVLDMYDILDLPQLPNRTIHDGPIIWQAEVAQDQLRTIELTDRHLDVGALASIVSTLTSNRNRLEMMVNFRRKTGSKEDRDTLGATLWALAVINVRTGRVLGNQVTIQAGLTQAEQISRYLPNTHRLTTLALWALQESQKPANNKVTERETSQKLRNQAISCLVKSFIRDRRGTMTVIGPELEKRGLAPAQLARRAKVFLKRIVSKF